MSTTRFLLEGYIVGYARVTMNHPNITHHPNKHIIERRVKIIKFFEAYGRNATQEAFSVSRSTVYLWKQKLKQNHDRLESLSPASKAPKHRRKREVDPRITGFIINQRRSHPRLGKDKLAVLLIPECRLWSVAAPCASTVGRLLNDLKGQGKLPKHGKLSVSGATGKLIERRIKTKLNKQRRGSYYPRAAGDLVQIDCVVKFIGNLRRYVISAIDYQSEFAFSMSYSHLSSAKAQDFLLKLVRVAPFELKRAQTDNGSEFYKLFHRACEDLNITHFWNYPRSPKMNAKIERYNRSIQEEFIDWRLDDLGYDLPGFNHKLMDWLIWYNTKRPHWSLKLKSPMAHLLELLQLNPEKSNMLWTDTNYLQKAEL